MSYCEPNNCCLCGEDMSGKYSYHIRNCKQDRNTICPDCLRWVHFQEPSLWEEMTYVEKARCDREPESTDSLISDFIAQLDYKLHEMWDKKED